MTPDLETAENPAQRLFFGEKGASEPCRRPWHTVRPILRGFWRRRPRLPKREAMRRPCPRRCGALERAESVSPLLSQGQNPLRAWPRIPTPASRLRPLREKVLAGRCRRARTPIAAPRRVSSAHETTDPNRWGKRIMGAVWRVGINLMSVTNSNTPQQIHRAHPKSNKYAPEKAQMFENEHIY